MNRIFIPTLVFWCCMGMLHAQLPNCVTIGDDAYPEDNAVYNGILYTSNFLTGAITSTNLATGESTIFVEAATDVYTSGWGLRIDPNNNVLITILNQPYDFTPANANAGQVRTYSLADGSLVDSWDLPTAGVGNSVEVDAAGNIYVGDIGPDSRIIKIDPTTDEITTWADDTQWADGGFGTGGMIYNQTDAFYVSQGGTLWYVPVNEDGSAGAAEAVSLSGLVAIDSSSTVSADGMTWAGNGTIFYAENDVFTPGPNGIVHAIQLSDATTGTASRFTEGLTDVSGVYFASYEGQDYLFANESQFGVSFGVDAGPASNPFCVKAFPVRDAKVALPECIAIGENAYPEDVKYWNGYVYTSNFITAQLTKTNVTTGEQSILAPALGDGSNSSGMWVDLPNGLLLSTFNPVEGLGKINAYSLEADTLVQSWDLPAGSSGNAITVDLNGQIYVTDIGETGQIIRISRPSNEVSVWTTPSVWTGNFLGNIAYNGSTGFYVSFGGTLWFLPLQEDGSAGEAQAVTVSGIFDATGTPSVGTDGVVWVGENTLYYNENDVSIPGPNGIVHKLVFSDDTTAEAFLEQRGIAEPSGLDYAEVNGASYLLVAESQFGVAFGVDAGPPNNPFCIKAFPVREAAEVLPECNPIGDDAYPEDNAVYNGYLYTTNFLTGAISRTDLVSGETIIFVPAATDVYTSGWGLRIDPVNNVLIALLNQPYDFNPANANAGQVRTYSLADGSLVDSWDLPTAGVGNSVEVDAAGNIYVGDIGPDSRIIKIDRATDEVTSWADDAQWADGGFGTGGMIYNQTDAFYVSQGGTLWYVPVNEDGSAGAAEAVSLSGLVAIDSSSTVSADGMTWAGDNVIFYAENDVFTPGPNGIVHAIRLTDATTGQASRFVEGLTDVSGVYFADFNGQDYLFANESQFGVSFGVDAGPATNPFCVKAFTVDLSAIGVVTSIDGISGRNTLGFKLFPNPTSGLLNVELEENKTVQSLRLYSLDGRLVYALEKKGHGSSVESIDLAGLNSGIYLIQLIDNTNTMGVQKLILRK